MNYRFSRHLAPMLLLCAALIPGVASADTGPDNASAVVLSFNQAITNRNLDGLLSHFADGGVQFILRPSHQGLTDEALTADLNERWSMVAPVLFSATKKYEREAEIIDSQVMGDIATVWAEIESETVLPNGKTNEEEFTEVYLLIKRDGDWKIAAIADNRQPNTMMGGN